MLCRRGLLNRLREIDRLCILSVFLLPGLVQGQQVAPVAAEGEAARLNNVGTALMNQQLLDAAAAKFEAAYRLDPKLTVAKLNQGIALLYLQKLPEATEALELAAAKNPGNPRIWYVLGLVYRSANEPQKGVAAFRHALTIDPNNADAHYFLGSFLLELHDLAGARAEYQTALHLSPLHASAEFGLGRVLQREGDSTGAKTALERFQYLTNAKLASPMSHNYGEEGALGRVENAPSRAPQVGPMIPVSFSKIWESHASGVPNISEDARFGGGCLIDTDGKGAKTLILMGHGDVAVRVYRVHDSAGEHDASFDLVPATEMGLGVRGEGVACAVGDFDNDGLPDLALAMSDRVLLFRNAGGGKFEDVTKAAGILTANRPSNLIFVDYDHDGDLDLFVTGEGANGAGPNVLWRNNGDKTFTNWTKQAGLAGEGSTTAAMLSDLNNDRAVDLLVTGSGAAPTFFANPRDGAFLPTPLYSGDKLPSTVGVAIFDFNKDGWMDIALTHSGAPGVTLWRNVDGRRFERVPLPLQDAIRGWGITTLDIDNDGWLDLAVVIETVHGPTLRMLRNMGQAGFRDVTAEVKLDAAKLTSPRTLLTADVDNDGAADLIVTELDGGAVALRNVGGNRNHSVRIGLKGLADNKSALGTKVEVYADSLWQKWEVTSPQDVIAGIGTADKADLVRLLWPTGVPQDELDVSAAKRQFLTELDRRGSSCPTLFAWDGTKFSFVTDVIGAGVVGHWISPTRRNTPDPDEWIKIDGAQLKEHGGMLGLRFGEPMEEVNFIDQVRLVAVDHPVGTEVYPNERFLSERPFAPAETILSRNAQPPVAAWDDHGRDVLGLLRERDHVYVKDFTNLPFAGFANQHTLTFKLGEWTPTHPLRLLLHGFVEYFSASSMYAASQAGITPVPPYLEAELPNGSWQRIVDDMGFPAGLPRTIVVDLSGKLPVGSHSIRMTTNLQIYWDQVLVDNGAEPPVAEHVRQTELPLNSAQLAFRGYPQQLDGRTPGDLTYNYQRISQTGPFVRQRGAYTHYGYVQSLLQKIDDQYVIFGSGEDMDLEFSAAAQPDLPKGWVRDYFFYANGFVKDMDFYEASPFTVNALPFHGMTDYPYSRKEHYPGDSVRTAYQLEWNDRFDSGDDRQQYQFHYVPSVSVPQITDRNLQP
jgi:Flp pilus assembly protein TadD